MRAQDNIERVLRRLHIVLSKSEAYAKEPSKVIVDKQLMLDLLSELNKCVYDIMDQYELTKQSRDRAERQFQKHGDEIVLDASRKAEDIYAASVMYTNEALSRVYNIMMDTADNVGNLYKDMQERFEKEQRLVRSNQLELKSQLQDLVDTEKYLKIIEDRNKEIEKEHNEGKDLPPEKNIYADRRGEIKINNAYFEQMGIPIEDENEQGEGVVTGASQEGNEAQTGEISKEMEAQIQVNLDADYFKWKEAQENDNAAEGKSEEKEGTVEGFVNKIKKQVKSKPIKLI